MYLKCHSLLGAHPGYYFGSLVIINKPRHICIIILAIFSHVILHFVAPILGYELADLTVHPSPQNCRGWVHFFRIGV